MDLPTSRAQIFHEREARGVDFFMFSAAKAGERANINVISTLSD